MINNDKNHTESYYLCHRLLMCLLVVYGFAQSASDHWLRQQAIRRKPKLSLCPSCLVIFCPWQPVATRGNPWQPVATRGNPWPKARVAPGRPKEWLGSAGGMSRQCEDLRTHCHWMPLDVIGSFGTWWSFVPIPGSVAGFCGSKSYGDHWAGWWGRAWSCWIKYTSGLKRLRNLARL